MNVRSQGKAKTLFIYPGSENPYISVKGLKGESVQSHKRLDSAARLPDPCQVSSRDREHSKNSQDLLEQHKSEKYLSPKGPCSSILRSHIPSQSANSGYPEEQAHPLAPKRLRKKVLTHNMRSEQLQCLREQNRQLQARVDSLEVYFSKIGLVDAQQENSNLNLKVLLQQQKISSLIYMLRQYRSGNRSESSMFEKKLEEFEPQLEKDLTDKLAYVNKDLEKAQEELESLRLLYQQCSADQKGRLSWAELINNVTDTRQHNEMLLSETAALRAELMKARVDRKEFDEMEQNRTLLKVNNRELLAKKAELERELSEARNEAEQYRRRIEQVEYELSQKRCLEAQLRDRNEVVHETALKLARVQNENFTVRGKLEGVLKDFNGKIFQETSIVEKLGTCFSQTTENRLKFTDCLSSMRQPNQSDPAESFRYLLHLYDRSQEIYESIISEFRAELESLRSQVDNSHRLCKSMREELQSARDSNQRQNGQLLSPLEKLLKYLAHLREIQADCEHCETVRSYHEQMKSIMEMMSVKIASA